jgi:MoxR-like ATPase
MYNNGLVREEIRKIQSLMESAEYVTDAPVATSVYLAQSLRKPLLIEGHAGVGKTEVAKVMAGCWTEPHPPAVLRGLDASAALYEWNYQKQLLHIKLDEGAHKPVDQGEHEIFSSVPAQAAAAAGHHAGAARRCCWWTRSIAPTRNSRLSCSRSSRTGR